MLKIKGWVGVGVGVETFGVIVSLYLPLTLFTASGVIQKTSCVHTME